MSSWFSFLSVTFWIVSCFLKKCFSLILDFSNKAGQGIEGPQGSCQLPASSVFSSSKIEKSYKNLSAVKLSSLNFTDWILSLSLWKSVLEKFKTIEKVLSEALAFHELKKRATVVKVWLKHRQYHLYFYQKALLLSQNFDQYREKFSTKWQQ